MIARKHICEWALVTPAASTIRGWEIVRTAKLSFFQMATRGVDQDTYASAYSSEGSGWKGNSPSLFWLKAVS